MPRRKKCAVGARSAGWVASLFGERRAWEYQFMCKRIRSIAVILALVPAISWGSCDAVKASIDAKLKAKNLSGYSLDVRDADDPGDGKVVGNCNAGKKVIVYKRAPSRPSTTTK